MMLKKGSLEIVQFYYKEGIKFQKEGKLDDAITAYRKALQLKPNFIPAYKKMLYLYKRKGWLRPRFYSINHKYKLIYCMIPKNATTLFKTMMINNSDYRAEYENSSSGPHKYIRNHDELSLTDFSYFKNSEYFKFVILRNPFERLVSGYYDKFVKPKKSNYNLKHPFKNVIENVYKNLDQKPDIHQSITFNQFIHYLTRTEDFELDCHWRPQSTFLVEELLDFDFIGQFEKLDFVIEYLEKKFSFKIRQDILNPAHSSHVTQYGSFNSHKNPCDMYPEDLCLLESFPKAQQLYTPELEELIRARYAKDIEIYEREFNLPLKI